MHKQPLLIVLGPTASGKTRLAVHLAAALEGEIISADSRQVFKGMDIGTGKDLADYKVEGKTISHHLIDICNAGERYQVNRFKEDFYKALNEIATRAKLPILSVEELECTYIASCKIISLLPFRLMMSFAPNC
jgi:tRNA dimethylallyltransferase